MTLEDESILDGFKGKVWEAAMAYLQAGLSIIPIRFSDKKPALEWKEYQDRQPTEEEVTSWFEDGVPSGNGGLTKVFNIAIITGKISGLVVVDCDNQDALTYAVSEAGLFSMLTVATTRGQHIYFKHPGDRVQCKAGGLGRDWPAVSGLDLRGDGGYVVAPPSVKLNSEGKFIHEYKFNCPHDEVENFLSSLPVFPGVKIRTKQVPVGEWSFDNLQLSAVKTYGESVWDDMKERVDSLGRKLRDGDGRNPWLVRYVGECVATGMDEGQARAAAEQFQSEFFSPTLDAVETESVISSVIRTDKLNHPEKYVEQEKYDNKTEQRKSRADAIRLIRPNNLAQLKKMSAGKKFLIDPFIPPQSIIQVVGFNGHGKSLWLMSLLWAAAKGRSFGSAHVDGKIKALYLDFEGSVTTLNERTERCENMIGEMDDNFTIWNANVSGDDLPLTDGDAIIRLQEIINDVQPQLVVLDTVRQAWSGMEENSPHSWVKVNHLAMTLRNAGMSVVLVHHRNKPNMQGHGREAGSTAQLKDLDLQIIVTKVVADLDQAKREAAIPDSSTSIADFSGGTSTAWSYLRRTLPNTAILKMVFELSFGKQRQATENHVTTYVGMAEDKLTGRWTTVSSLTPIQKSHALKLSGMSVTDIAERIGVSQPTVNGWLNKQ
jgi:hypothetical protein